MYIVEKTECYPNCWKVVFDAGEYKISDNSSFHYFSTLVDAVKEANIRNVMFGYALVTQSVE